MRPGRSWRTPAGRRLTKGPLSLGRRSLGPMRRSGRTPACRRLTKGPLSLRRRSLRAGRLTGTLRPYGHGCALGPLSGMHRCSLRPGRSGRTPACRRLTKGPLSLGRRSLGPMRLTGTLRPCGHWPTLGPLSGLHRRTLRPGGRRRRRRRTRRTTGGLGRPGLLRSPRLAGKSAVNNCFGHLVQAGHVIFDLDIVTRQNVNYDFTGRIIILG